MSQFTQTGLPGARTSRQAAHRRILLSEQGRVCVAGLNTIDGTKGADTGNTGNVRNIRAGKVMGRVTSGGKWAPAILGLSTGAITGASTTLLSSGAIGTELARRIGTSGTFKLTGPPSAAGVVRTLTVTFSAVNQSTGDITITALGVNQVDQIDIAPAGSGGNIKLTVQKPDGTFVTTANIAWNTTDATYLAAINSALDTATGVSGGIVASAIPAVDTDLGFRLTYSGTGYAGLAWTAASVALFPTTSTIWSTWRVTAAVDGRFVTGSFIQPTDGSETLRLLVGDTYGIKCTDQDGASQDQEWQQFAEALAGGYIDTDKIIDVPADTALLAYLKAQLKLNGGPFLFSDDVT